MDTKAKAEINSIINELNSIIRDLNNTANELKEFKGIGTEYCSQKLYKVASHYNQIKNNLYELT
jgi:hypothetical protein